MSPGVTPFLTAMLTHVSLGTTCSCSLQLVGYPGWVRSGVGAVLVPVILFSVLVVVALVSELVAAALVTVVIVVIGAIAVAVARVVFADVSMEELLEESSFFVQ